MTKKQFIAACASMLRLMQKNGISIKDIEILEMVNEAEALERQGEQKGYIVNHLAEKYDVSVRSVYSTIKRLNEEIIL